MRYCVSPYVLPAVAQLREAVEAAASGRQPVGGASRPVLNNLLPENNVNIVDLRLVALQLISCVSFTHADQ